MGREVCPAQRDGGCSLLEAGQGHLQTCKEQTRTEVPRTPRTLGLVGKATALDDPSTSQRKASLTGVPTWASQPLCF